jgi:hypothetical protein
VIGGGRDAVDAPAWLRGRLEMAGKRREDDRACHCDRPDVSCVGLTVRRLSSERCVSWQRRSGRHPPEGSCRLARPGPARQPPRRVRPGRLPAPPPRGAPGLASRLVVADGGGARGDRRRRPAGRPDRGRLAGLAHGPGGGAGRRMAAALPPLDQCQRLASAGRDAAPHGQRAAAPRAAGRPGAARRHPAGLAGQPRAPGGRPDRRLVIQSWRRAQPPPLHKAPSPSHAGNATVGPLPELRWQAAAIADALADGVLLPVRPLLCVPSGWPLGRLSVEGITVATTRQLVDVIGQGPPLQASDLEWATTRALDLLRPAA